MKKSYLITLPLLFISASHCSAKQRWMEHSRFGLMFHYEAFVDHSTESYNRTIDSFDVKGSRRQSQARKPTTSFS